MSEEQYVDMEGMTAWIAEHTDLPRATVGAVLMLEMDYMQAVGIINDPGWESLGYYSAGSEEDSLELDCDRLAQDAERLLGISADSASVVTRPSRPFWRCEACSLEGITPIAFQNDILTLGVPKVRSARLSTHFVL